MSSSAGEQDEDRTSLIAGRGLPASRAAAKAGRLPRPATAGDVAAGRAPAGGAHVAAPAAVAGRQSSPPPRSVPAQWRVSARRPRAYRLSGVRFASRAIVVLMK
ncbi:hypothetical protein EVAR_31652_1 [Eumeta japonica]|uniref:Uncharacterized protein n=1 Tax=Eumeta variegata TaxID=151549 RepID=A0A4C1VYU4_EUMVA|nr:hypothetical protein EVAR_31652_1 [Eumeta japonica]